VNQNWEVGLGEELWSKDKNVELTPNQDVLLTGDRELNSIKTAPNDNGSTKLLNLNGHKLTIGEGGVVFAGGRPHIIEAGTLTSSVGRITFTPIADATYLLSVTSIISDNKGSKVGIDLIGPRTWLGYRGIGLSGSKANTFTGDVNIIGGVRLDLYKDDGVISVSGNLNVKDGAVVSVYRSGQIARSARVLLQSKNKTASILGLNSHHKKDIKEEFSVLVVDGEGVIDFLLDKNKKPHGLREIILDDLQVLEGSHLLVKEWQDGRDRLLVRKDSAHVRDSLKRIEFEAHDTRSVNLRDYDKDYWEIYALVPEPATYGALFGAVGLMAVWCRQRRGQKPRESQCSGLT